jgi:acetyl-CoA carboxylase biotin carboxylase subunit
MFKKILIANRGEVALRVIRACRELGIKTVAVYSSADRDSLHVRFADEAICIGPARSADSYLNQPAIVSAAELSGAEAIHPGYGFLSENADFAQVCADCDLTFIGPSPDTINRMGNKSEAKRTMREAGVPVVPGTDGTADTVEEALESAKEMGFPVMIKASAGGGGRGMRIAYDEEQLKTRYAQARAEAMGAFNNDDVYIEKFIDSPKHIEIQLLGDSKGNAIHLGERDCSVQRRHQKLIEEALGPTITPELRQKMGDASVKACEAIGYEGAGTIEYLLDAKNNFYFMEMNTRVQVEHTITEEVTGIDIVKEQIQIASGKKLSLTQKQVTFNGHAIQLRINAEDPKRGFAPCPGRITALNLPGGPGIRIDTHVFTEYVIPPHYDSMIAKLVVVAKTRREAIARAKRACAEFVVEGIKTTIPFHEEVLSNGTFKKGNFGINFVEQHMSHYLQT